jgi:hypothetical protein
MLYDTFVVSISKSAAEGAIVEMRCFEFLSIIGIFYCTQLVSVMSGATSGDVVECVKQSEGAVWFDAPNRRAEERECP